MKQGLRIQDVSQRKLSVLVVDDEDFNLEIIGELLHDRGYQVDTAENGVQACRVLQASPDKFQCVLLDRMMPEMDGMEVLRFMKDDPGLRYIPVVMQTAKATRQDIQDGLNAGVLYYITKPFNEKTLMNIVDSAVAEYLHWQDLTQSVSGMHMRADNHGKFVFRTLDEARHIATVLASTCPSPEAVVFGLVELLVNAVEHGNLGISFDDKTRLLNDGTWSQEVNRRLALPENIDKKVTVTLDITDSEIRFLINDEGPGFDSEQYLSINPDRACSTHGRGIAMAKMVSFDRIEFLDGGNKVLAAVRLNEN